MKRNMYISGLYQAVAIAVQKGVDSVAPVGPDIMNRSPHWPGLASKKMAIDNLNVTDRSHHMNVTDHSHHMNGAKECARRRAQKAKGMLRYSNGVAP